MKVGLDLRCLPSDGSLGAGVAHAARALCSQLIKDKSIDWKVFITKGSVWNEGLKHELENGQSKTLRLALKKDPCDILFVPSGAVSLGIDIPAIPWVHDLIIFDHPKWFPESWLHRQLTTHLFLRGIKCAPIVFAVSEYTKQAIIRQTRVSSEKVIVTYEGGDEQLTIKNEQLTIKKSASEYCRGKWRIENPFVLVLGTVEPRKNLAMLIRAWKKSLTPNPSPTMQERGADLVLAGQNGWKFEDVNREIESLDAESRQYFHRLENINDDDKRQLLLAASTVAVPSLDEGFGLVALEALQSGTQVIASNRGALPEVVGQAGLLLDPEDEEAWTESIAQISNSKYQIARVDQAKKFSWEKTAGVVLEGLKRLDKNPKKS